MTKSRNTGGDVISIGASHERATPALRPKRPADELRTITARGLDAGGAAPTERQGLRSGDVVAERYRVVREIGSGGMGTVYEATHLRLGKAFALKVLHADVAGEKLYRNQFFREAKYASTFVHPGLASVVDFGDLSDASPFMVMEHIEGRLLSSFLCERGQLSLRRSCELILQVAEGLRYMHDRNVVHCDIKPSNIILSEIPEGRRGLEAKIIDFGIARSVGSRRSDTIGGTPEYMSPEAIKKQPPTPASDVYALGILFYELLVGAPPFTGEVLEVLSAHVYDTPPSLVDQARLTPGPFVRRLVERALAKEPGERHASMDAFVHELRSAMTMLDTDAPALAEASGAVRFARGTQRPRKPSSTAEVTELPGALLAAAFARAPVAMASLDGDGRIVAANQAFANVLGVAECHLQGMSVAATPLARDWGRLRCELAVALCEPRPRTRVQAPLRFADGLGLAMCATLESAGVGSHTLLTLLPNEAARA